MKLSRKETDEIAVVMTDEECAIIADALATHGKSLTGLSNILPDDTHVRLELQKEIRISSELRAQLI